MAHRSPLYNQVHTKHPDGQFCYLCASQAELDGHFAAARRAAEVEDPKVFIDSLNEAIEASYRVPMHAMAPEHDPKLPECVCPCFDCRLETKRKQNIETAIDRMRERTEAQVRAHEAFRVDDGMRLGAERPKTEAEIAYEQALEEIAEIERDAGLNPEDLYTIPEIKKARSPWIRSAVCAVTAWALILHELWRGGEMRPAILVLAAVLGFLPIFLRVTMDEEDRAARQQARPPRVPVLRDIPPPSKGVHTWRGDGGAEYRMFTDRGAPSHVQVKVRGVWTDVVGVDPPSRDTATTWGPEALGLERVQRRTHADVINRQHEHEARRWPPNPSRSQRW